MADFETDVLAYARTGDWGKIKEPMDVAQPQVDFWLDLEPTREEILEYLSLVDKAGKSGQAGKARATPSVEADRAIKSLATWVGAGPVSCFNNSDINVHRSTFQLALRVCWPELLHQGGCGFCGPTTMLYEFAHRYPAAYAKCGMDLIEKGKGRIEINRGTLGLDIEIDPSSEAKDWQAKEVPEMDFIMLRGIRKRAELLVPGSSSGGQDFKFDNNVTHATTPSQIAEVLRTSGYTEVKDCTISWPGRPGGSSAVGQRSVNLLGCTFLCKMPAPRPIVIMLVNGKPVNDFFTGTVPTTVPAPVTSQLADLHWIVVEDLDAAGSNVEGKIITWTRAQDFSFAKDVFLGSYYGYVTGKP